MSETRQLHAYMTAAGAVRETNEFVTIGYVVDTNDPQQMGRVRAVCPAWGDSYETIIDDLPWALYITPFGGQVTQGTRGPGIQSSEGGVAYGMWAVPKVGAQVLIMCVDGNPQHRVYIGCLYDQFTPHTMPHGRWKQDDHPALDKAGSNPKPFGPYTSREGFIEPLAENIHEAFAYKNEPNYEWRTRAADYQVAAVDVSQLNSVYSEAPDDKQFSQGGWETTQGYQVSRIDPNAPSASTARNYDNMVYSWTSPGFHALSMDDRQENCRVRFRTAAGHQIIMDDTNERIYIQTAKGRNWIEMDQAGNIDIFTTNKVSVRSRKDINLTSDETIRMHAGKGIHMYSGGDIRMQAKESIYQEALTAIHQKSTGNINLNAVASMNLLSSGSLLLTSPGLGLNGPPAQPAESKPPLWTNRVPDHEPWARTMTKSDTTHAPEVPYTSDMVGRTERGVTIERGKFWRR